jgi:hypothetical protein
MNVFPTNTRIDGEVSSEIQTEFIDLNLLADIPSMLVL